jgi:very-short-patch-repair endonuclease
MSPALSKRSLERRSRQIARARSLRQSATEAETAAWKILRSFRRDGLIFRRQHPVGKFIVDFCCVEESLIVELGGSVHSQPAQAARDQKRDGTLKRLGYRAARFSNGVVLSAQHEFVSRVFGLVADGRADRFAPLPPTALPQGGEGL